MIFFLRVWGQCRNYFAPGSVLLLFWTIPWNNILAPVYFECPAGLIIPTTRLPRHTKKHPSKAGAWNRGLVIHDTNKGHLESWLSLVACGAVRCAYGALLPRFEQDFSERNIRWKSESKNLAQRIENLWQPWILATAMNFGHWFWCICDGFGQLLITYPWQPVPGMGVSRVRKEGGSGSFVRAWLVWGDIVVGRNFWLGGVY